jgi:Zn-dependent protease with chaperone function
MPILLLLFLTLACLEEDWRRWDWLGSPQLSAVLTLSLIAFWVSLARYLSQWTCRSVAARPETRDLIAQRYGRLRFYHTVGLYLVYSGALYGLGWGAFVQSLAPSDATLFPGGELLVLAPFFAGLIFSWMYFYDAERALHGTGPDGEVFYWSRSAYIGFHIRTNLGLVAIPIFLLIAQRTVGRFLSEYGPEWSGYVAHFFGLGVALAIFFCLPWLLRLILKLQPMPEGPIRTRLSALAQRLKFRCSDILLWNTRRGLGGGIANAMVAGVLPRPRYVLMTDRLIAELTPAEIDAVFGHEVGHIKHHHIPYYASFLIISIGVLWLCAAWVLPDNDMVHQLAAFPFVALLAAYIFLVFGFLTRRCERQADIYGCRAVSCGRPDCTGHEEGAPIESNGKLCPTGIRTFIAALEKVVRLNGIDPDKPGFFQSWQHSTPARRVEFMRRMLADAGVETRFQRKVALVKWGLLIGLSTALVFLAALTWWD